MLFNSYIFLLVFLPLTLAFYHGIRFRIGTRAGIATLVVASFVFYGWWSPKYLPLLLGLMAADYLIAGRLICVRERRPGLARLLVSLGVLVNVSALAYYKYANFFVDNLNDLTGFDVQLATVVLPIGISFFTFQKIAFLVDVYKGKVSSFDLLDYALFVTFFPQLIAGPIVHHSEMMPQFARPRSFKYDFVSLGLTIFVIGLSKKLLLADTAAGYASPQFDAVANGAVLGIWAAWSAALAYTVQLYFDFSAYSDMAVGLGLMFGICLPVNFDSPYKSASIIEFWRRWHITLSRFLRDYIYIPLGGNRKGKTRRHVNLMVTMAIGGFWHGAGWNFLIWGALHGCYLIINHAWRGVMGTAEATDQSLRVKIFSGAVTFLAVVIAWVFFRAVDLDSALSILASMFAVQLEPVSAAVVNVNEAWVVVVLMLFLAWFGPNTYQMVGYEGPEGSHPVERFTPGSRMGLWQVSPGWAFVVGGLLAVNIASMSNVSEFIYFQF
jgi:D-alanyl-lipoteichoic acid acyltransferase DltB (MBOAT superfamily)